MKAKPPLVAGFITKILIFSTKPLADLHRARLGT